MTVAELLERLSKLPLDAEVRVTVSLDKERSINAPATGVSFEQFGPLIYVEVI